MSNRNVAAVAVLITVLMGSACDSSPVETVPVVTAPPAAAVQVTTQVATVGVSFTYDATMAGQAFTDPKAKGLSYAIAFSPASNGLAAVAGRVTGSPTAPGVVTARVIATDTKGDTASQSFRIIAFAQGLATPSLPTIMFAYSDASSPLPAHFVNGPASALLTDNTPATNRTTDPGATLGRVLFYDPRLSVNDRVSCGSCHIQSAGFSDTAKLSRGFNGEATDRHGMALGNARFYARGRFFWDERAATLEAQVLEPVQNAVEMGMTLENLVLKVGATSYYPALFQAAFGSSEVTSARISQALAQYVRSLVTGTSRFDAAFVGAAPPNFSNLTAQENEGFQIFTGVGGCAACHGTNANVSDGVHNTGLDATVTDVGAGGGRFKAPSLRNVAVRAPYMHDGRFRSLAEVVAFYDTGVQNNPNLDPRLRAPGGGPVRRLNLTPSQRDALVAFLGTLTDPAFLTSPKFSNPFVH